jgi:hypothetical protein
MGAFVYPGDTSRPGRTGRVHEQNMCQAAVVNSARTGAVPSDSTLHCMPSSLWPGRGTSSLTARTRTTLGTHAVAVHGTVSSSCWGYADVTIGVRTTSQ